MIEKFSFAFYVFRTAPVVKNSQYLLNTVNNLDWNLLHLSKKRPKLNKLESFSIPCQISTSAKRWKLQLPSKTNLSTFLQIVCSNFRLKLCERP